VGGFVLKLGDPGDTGLVGKNPSSQLHFRDFHKAGWGFQKVLFGDGTIHLLVYAFQHF
jgi:hypothetical protein